jgi:hypothetical protein
MGCPIQSVPMLEYGLSSWGCSDRFSEIGAGGSALNDRSARDVLEDDFLPVKMTINLQTADLRETYQRPSIAIVAVCGD